MIPRIIKLTSNHSFFLFGPRGTGKSTLLRSIFNESECYYLDLLDFELESRLVQKPQEFSQLLNALPSRVSWVVVDEIQKIPALLDEVHRFIESHPGFKFAMTGSSARKLKRDKANLLAGRAFTYTLFPFTSTELGRNFNLDDALNFGTLPKISALESVQDKEMFLRSYCQTYLKEEILLESLVRNLPSFRRFLPLAAEANGQVLSWSSFARDIGVDVKTVRSYFEILEDTLVGFLLPAYSKSIRKRQRTHSKFYFFDTGVRRAMANRLTVPLEPRSVDYGWAFEHFWLTEIQRHNVYRRTDYTLSYFGTHDVEIDLVIERPSKPTLFVEFKSSEKVHDQELRPLLEVARSVKGSVGLCVCRETRRRKVENLLVCPWQEALDEIF